MQTPTNTKTVEAGERTQIGKRGIVERWNKDGAWHIALPCPAIVDGLQTGGFRWTATQYPNKQAAIAAIEGRAN